MTSWSSRANTAGREALAGTIAAPLNAVLRRDHSTSRPIELCDWVPLGAGIDFPEAHVGLQLLPRSRVTPKVVAPAPGPTPQAANAPGVFCKMKLAALLL